MFAYNDEEFKKNLVKHKLAFGDDLVFNDIVYAKSLTEYKGTSGILDVPHGTVAIWFDTRAEFKSLLRRITMTDSVKELYEDCFYSCSNLESIKLSNRITKIPFYCFAECSKLVSIELPSNLESICDNAFSNSGLKSIILPKSITYLGSDIFSGTYISELYVSDNIRSINGLAFRGMQEGCEITLPERCKRNINPFWKDEYSKIRFNFY